MSASKHWVFTINNYTEDDLKHFENNEQFEYVILGKEIGDSGTPHIQGYAICKRRVAFNTAKRLINRRAHVEKKKGSVEQAAQYCKKDGDYIEHGESPSRQGQRSDLAELYARIKAGGTREEVGDAFPAQYIRYKRSIDILMRERVDQPRTLDSVPEVIVHWGDTGTGKTRAVWQDRDPNTIFSHAGDKWFDGYVGQPIALFDDFDGSVFKLHYFLKILDRYPFQVPVKGAFINWRPDKIYITSNKNPLDWYPNAFPKHQEALHRRFTSIQHFE